MIPLIKEETIVSRSGDHTITLTDVRITQKNEDGFTSICLDKISCCKIQKRNNPLFIALVVALMLIGMIWAIGANPLTAETGFAIVGIGVVSFIIYFFTRLHLVSVISDSGQTIQFKTNGMGTDEVVEFINKIDTARIQFVI